MSNPDIIFDHDFASVAALSVPHSLSNDVVRMVVRADQCHVTRNHHLVADFYIALEQTATSDSNVVSDHDVLVWRPHHSRPLHMNITAMSNPRVAQTEVQNISQLIEKMIAR